MDEDAAVVDDEEPLLWVFAVAPAGVEFAAVASALTSFADVVAAVSDSQF